MNRKRLTSLLILLLLIGAIIGVSVLVQQESNLRGPLATIGGILAVLFLAAAIINDAPGVYNILRRLWQKLLGQDPDAYPVPTPEPRLAKRNRQTMLLKVKAYWIDGVLANSLHSKIIPLDMEHRPDAVTRPRLMDILFQPKEQPPQPVPPGTRLITLFNPAAGDALLILGDPGSGKTTLLLELARDLLAWADQSDDRRIPVVFNLSTWATQQPPLTDWLTRELQTLYLIPQQVAQTWVQQDDILPLLDGLDEVAPEHRAACIQAINIYRQAHGIPLVVCSRTADYEAIGTKLHLSDAILLKALTPTQINDYLASGGRALDPVRHAIQQDEVFQEMAQSPLLLSIMAIAYRNQPPEQFTTTNPADRRHQLFTTYIQRQLPQRQKDPREDTSTTLYQLTCLAHQMTAHDQTVFLIERLQPDWLPTSSQQHYYRLTTKLVIGLIVGLSLGLIGGLLIGLIFGSGIGIVAGLTIGLSIGLIRGWVLGRFGRIDRIETVEKTSWSYKRMTKTAFVFGRLGWLVGGLTGGAVGWLILGEIGAMLGALVCGMTLRVVLGLFSGLINGLIIKEVDLVSMPSTPNEGIKNSAKNALRLSLTAALTVGLGMGSVSALFGWSVIGLTGGILMGALSGLMTGIGSALGLGFGKGGGKAVIQHYTLRFWLYHYDYLPFRNLIPFLDLAAERLILQKVGGGYRFIHRTLQDYLATLYIPPSSSTLRKGPGDGHPATRGRKS